MQELGLSTSQLKSKAALNSVPELSRWKVSLSIAAPKGIYLGELHAPREPCWSSPSPCVGFTMCPRVLQLPTSSLSADLFSRYSACRRWIRSCGYRADPRASPWCAAPHWLPGREIWNFEGGGRRRRRRVFSGKAKPQLNSTHGKAGGRREQSKNSNKPPREQQKNNTGAIRKKSSS